MTSKDTLGDRMKRAEVTSQSTLLRRMPAIIRIDGRAFHTFAKRVAKSDPAYGATPFSQVMRDCMVFTTGHLVQNIQGCVLGYTQSDEISLLLRDWDELETQAWFGNNVQKIVSVSASIASQGFNYYYHNVAQVERDAGVLKIADYATFDSRVYNLPREEVQNYFVWRQQDASRNSVQMLGHHFFSQREMHAKNNSQVQDLLMLEKGINWNDMPVWAKRGTCVEQSKHGDCQFVINDNIPVFTQDPTYIKRFLLTPSEVAANV